MKNIKSSLGQIYNGLNGVEVKGYDNVNRMFGAMYMIQELIKYMLNAYRVLLTRARAGMVICVPSGNPNKTKTGFWEDSTRLPEYYDGTYEYLKSLGIDEI